MNGCVKGCGMRKWFHTCKWILQALRTAEKNRIWAWIHSYPSWTQILKSPQFVMSFIKIYKIIIPDYVCAGVSLPCYKESHRIAILPLKECLLFQGLLIVSRSTCSLRHRSQAHINMKASMAPAHFNIAPWLSYTTFSIFL